MLGNFAINLRIFQSKIKWNPIKKCFNNMTNLEFPLNIFPEILKFPNIKYWKCELITQFHDFYYLSFIFAESGLLSKQIAQFAGSAQFVVTHSLCRGKKVKTDQKSYYR